MFAAHEEVCCLPSHSRLVTVSRTRVAPLTASVVAAGIHGDGVTDITDVRVIVGHLETKKNQW